MAVCRQGGNQSHGYTYSGSNTAGDVAWYYSNSGSTTHTVGTKAANELGIFDMTGNVCEWVWDIYGDYPSGAQTDPHGATSGSYRVVRGGSWNYSGYHCTVYYRDNYSATITGGDTLGFRCIRIFLDFGAVYRAAKKWAAEIRSAEAAELPV